MHESALVSLAILKVNWDECGKDYVECFIPFAVECIRQSTDDVVSLPWFQEQLKTQFGLTIPLNPLRMILVRASKKGYLRKEHSVFYRNVEKCSGIDFRDKQIKIEALHDGILRKLAEYAKRVHSVDWTEEAATAELHVFLRDNSLSLLFTFAEGGVYSGPNGRSGQGFIVGSFIAEAQVNDKQVVEDLVVLLQGNLLANALYLPDPGRVRQRFKHTRVYLDTSIIAYAAGYAGPIRAAPCLELLGLLKENGAELYCFRHTQDELRGILDACAERLRLGRFRDSFGPSMEYFIETGRTASDVELMAARLTQKIASLGITVDEKPPYGKEYHVDERAFETAIDSEIHYSSPKARVHDVDSIAAIARLRRGRESHYPESSWALFVTTNAPLAKVTRQFFQREASQGTVALCMTDYALGNLLWLKNPTKAPDLPRKQLLAHAYAAMQPPENLWKKYLAETARLQDQGKISSDDYYLLRHSLAAKSALMDLTQGEEAAFTEGTVQEVLAIAKERLRADLKEAVSREQESRRIAEIRVQKYEEESILRRSNLRYKAAVLARNVRSALLSIGAVAILLGSCYTFPWKLPRPSDGWGRYTLSGILLLLLLLSFVNLTWGVTLRSILDILEQNIANNFSRLFFRFAGMDEGAEANKSTEQSH